MITLHTQLDLQLTQSFQLCSQEISRVCQPLHSATCTKSTKTDLRIQTSTDLGILKSRLFLSWQSEGITTFYVLRWCRHSILRVLQALAHLPPSENQLHHFPHSYFHSGYYHFATFRLQSIFLDPQRLNNHDYALKKWLPPNTSILLKLVTTQILKT